MFIIMFIHMVIVIMLIIVMIYIVLGVWRLWTQRKRMTSTKSCTMTYLSSSSSSHAMDIVVFTLQRYVH